jgi:hypothetical protein
VSLVQRVYVVLLRRFFVFVLKFMKPYFKDNELVIPPNCDPKYRSWEGGQVVFMTLIELDAPAAVFANYTRQFPPSGDTCRCGKQAGSTSEVFYCVSCVAWWEKA